MNSNLIRSSRPYFPSEDIEKISVDIAETLKEGRLRDGKNLKLFEEQFACYIGTRYAIALDSDISAFETALRYYKIERREVIACTNSFISVPNSIVFAGGKVVFTDIRQDTLSMDVRSLEQKITPKTCGVIVTHIAGFPNPELKQIREICDEKSLFLIEDATHALGGKISDQKVGTFGDAAIFAFTPTKVATTGEGGMLITGNSKLAEYAKLFRYYGSGPCKTNFVELGRHMIMPEISAILGIYQLARVEEFIEKRNIIANLFNSSLDKLDKVNTIKCSSENRSSYYKYPLILNRSIKKEKFIQFLKDNNIETGTVFYPPCHLQPVYKNLELITEHLLNAEDVLARTITLPIHLGLEQKDVTYIIQKIQDYLR